MLRARGEWTAAVEALRQAEASLGALGRNGRLKKIEAACNLGNVLDDLGRYEESESSFANAVEWAREILPFDHGMRLWVIESYAYHELAAGRPEAAERRMRAQLGALGESLGVDAEPVLRGASILAMSLAAQGRTEEARDLFHETALRMERIGLRDRSRLVTTWNELGVLSRSVGDSIWAEVCFRRALEVTGSSPDTRAARRAVMQNLSGALLEHGRAGEAWEWMRASAREAEAMWGADDPRAAGDRSRLGMIEERLGDHLRAEDDLCRGVTALAEEPVRDLERLEEATRALAYFLYRRARYRESLPIFEDLAELVARRTGPESLDCALAKCDLAVALDRAGRRQESVKLAELLLSKLPSDHPRRRRLLVLLEPEPANTER